MTDQFITHIQSVDEPYKQIDIILAGEDFRTNGWEFLQEQVVQAMQNYNLSGPMTIWAEEC